MDIWLVFLLLVVLISINAFFALSEMAIVSVNKTRINMMIQEGKPGAKDVLRLATESQKFLSTIQVGITLAGFFSSASAAKYLADDFGRLIAKTGLDITTSETIAFVIVTILLSLFTLVLGELVPKRLALRYPEKFALKTYRVIKVIMFIFTPFVWVLSHSTNLILKLFRVDMHSVEESISEAEIRSLIESSAKTGGIATEESEMINSVFQFNDITAEEIMTPRTEVFLIDINHFSPETIDKMIMASYSRIPVYDKSPDDIIGVVYIKDVFREARRVGFENINLKRILKKAYFVPAKKKINTLFRELQATKNHLGLLVDEYGGFQGIVTIEDLIEEILGDIYDEYDEDTSDIVMISENHYLTNGMLSIEEVNKSLGIDIAEDAAYDTIAGFILAHLGFIPNDKDDVVLNFPTFTLKIAKMDDKRIDRVLITIHKNDSKR